MHRRRLLVAIPAVVATVLFLLLVAVNHELAQAIGGAYIIALITLGAGWDVFDRNGNGRHH